MNTQNFDWITFIYFIMFEGVSLLLGVILDIVMAKKHFETRIYIVVPFTILYTMFLFISISEWTLRIKGLALLLILIYASVSDLTDHHVDDYLSVLVLILAISNIDIIGLKNMLFGGLFVIIPQIIISFIKKNSIGGADIKLSTALGIFFGGFKGTIVLISGLLLSVICISIYNKIEKKENSRAYALIPFLSLSALVFYLI